MTDALITTAPEKVKQRSEFLPLTPLQQSFLFHSELVRGEVDVHVLQLVADIEADVDPDRLRAALAATLGRHAALRACFRIRRNGEPVQVVPPSVPAPLTCADLTNVPGAERSAAADELTRDDRTRPFDLSAPPLVRCTVIRLGESACRILLTVHHAVIDGWSMGLFIEEVFSRYAISGAQFAEPTPLRDFYACQARRDARPPTLRGRRLWLASRRRPSLSPARQRAAGLSLLRCTVTSDPASRPPSPTSPASTG